MDKVVSPERRRFLAATAASLLPLRGALAQGTPAAAVRAGNIAVIGEPGSIDPMLTLADLVNQIDQHFFETLYYMDPLFHIGPVLAAAMPEISSDGLRYTIPLRENVPFHDGTIMVADDVVATLHRWLMPAGLVDCAEHLGDAAVAPDPQTIGIGVRRIVEVLRPLSKDRRHVSARRSRPWIDPGLDGHTGGQTKVRRVPD